MKICMTAQAPSLDAPVDPRLGRAACFLIVDTDTDEFEAFENQGLQSAGGAGIAAARQVIDSGAKAVLTGNCGPNAFRTLQAGQVQVYTGVSGTVRHALAAFKAASLTPDVQASVDSHAGMGPQA